MSGLDSVSSGSGSVSVSGSGIGDRHVDATALGQADAPAYRPARDQAESLRAAIERARLRGAAGAAGSAAGAAGSVAGAVGSVVANAGPVAVDAGPVAADAVSYSDSDADSDSARQKPARVFAVTSGKGGVGKTNITANLAIALSEMGVRAVVIDADFGLANIEVLYGVLPQAKLIDIFASDRLAGDVLCEGPCGVKFISGGTGMDEAVRMDGEQAASLVASLSALDNEFDAVLIDTSAGLTDAVIGMLLAADEVILVTTPEPTSVTDAYALVKSLAQRDRDKPIRLVVNRAESQAEAADVMAKLIRVTGKFLDLQLGKLGYIQNDPLVVRSVKAQRPFIVGFPDSRPSQNVRDIASRLMERRAFGETPPGRGLAGFFGSISRLLHLQCK